MNYRTLNLGDRVVYRYDDFDGSGELLGVVKEVAEDHVLIGADGMDIWLDDDNSYMFSRAATRAQRQQEIKRVAAMMAKGYMTMREAFNLCMDAVDDLDAGERYVEERYALNRLLAAHKELGK